MNFTNADFDQMRRCAKRELDLRHQNYPKFIEKGRMTKEKADFEIDGMNKIYNYFCWIQIHSTPEQQKLF